MWREGRLWTVGGSLDGQWMVVLSDTLDARKGRRMTGSASKAMDVVY